MFFEQNDDTIIAFKGKDFICVGYDTRISSKDIHQIYGENDHKLKFYGNGDIGIITTLFYGDADYIDRFLKAHNDKFYFEHNKYMDIDNIQSLLSGYAFERSKSLFLYSSTVIFGFKTVIVDGMKVKVPTINAVSVGGSFEEENVVSVGSGRNFVKSCLDSFIGNQYHYSAKESTLNEDDALAIAESVLQNSSQQQCVSGGKPHLFIIRENGISHQKTIDLKKD